MLKRKESSGSDDISQPNKIYKLNEIETYVNEVLLKNVKKDHKYVENVEPKHIEPKHIYLALHDIVKDNHNDKQEKINELLSRYLYVNLEIKYNIVYKFIENLKDRTVLMYTIVHYLIYNDDYDEGLLYILIDFYNSYPIEKKRFSMNKKEYRNGKKIYRNGKKIYRNGKKIYRNGSTDLIELVNPKNWGTYLYPDKMPDVIDIISEIKHLDLTQENGIEPDEGKPAFLVLLEAIKPWYDEDIHNTSRRTRLISQISNMENMLATAAQLIKKDNSASINERTQIHLRSAINIILNLLPDLQEMREHNNRNKEKNNINLKDKNDRIVNNTENLHGYWIDLYIEIILKFNDLKLNEYLSEYPANPEIKEDIFIACIKKYVYTCLNDEDYREDNKRSLTNTINSLGNRVSDEEHYANIYKRQQQVIRQNTNREIYNAAADRNFNEKLPYILINESEQQENLNSDAVLGNDGIPTNESKGYYSKFPQQETVQPEITDMVMSFSQQHGRTSDDAFCQEAFNRRDSDDTIHEMVIDKYNLINDYINRISSFDEDRILAKLDTHENWYLGMLYEIIKVSQGLSIPDLIFDNFYIPIQNFIQTEFNDENLDPFFEEIKQDIQNANIESKQSFKEFHIGTIVGKINTKYGSDITNTNFIIQGEVNEENQNLGELYIRKYEEIIKREFFNLFFIRMSTYEGFKELINEAETDGNNPMVNEVFNQELFDEFRIEKEANGGKKKSYKNKSVKKNKKIQKITKKLKKNAKKKSMKRKNSKNKRSKKNIKQKLRKE